MEIEQYEIMRRQEDSLWWYVGMRQIIASVLPARGEWQGAMLILDAGCGTGANLEFLSARGTVFGVDIAEAALRHCQMRGLKSLSRASVVALPFAAESFDLVTTFDVIYHQAVPDDMAALRELHRVLRPGGKIIVRLPAYDWLRGSHDVAVHTRHRYSAEETGRKLTDAGFHVVRVTYANCLLLPLAIAKRFLESRGAELPADLSPPSERMNRLLTALLRFEARLLRRADLPWGLSVIGIGTKE